MSRSQTAVGYKHEDMLAAFNLLNIHTLKLGKALDVNNYAEACRAIRAIEDECANASRIAAVLSFKSRNNDSAARISRAAL